VSKASILAEEEQELSPNKWRIAIDQCKDVAIVSDAYLHRAVVDTRVNFETGNTENIVKCPKCRRLGTVAHAHRVGP